MRLAGRSALVLSVLALAAAAPAPAAAAEDKRQLLVVSGPFDPTLLRVVDPNGTPVRTLVSRPSNNLAFPSWSPDEKTVAYFENGQIRRQPAAGGTEVPVGPGGQPAFSPVAEEIAYWSWTSPTRTLRIIGANGLNDRPVAGPYTNPHPTPPAWSPDGKRLAFSHGGSILAVAATGGEVTTIASPAAGQELSRPAYSPDGTRIAYLSTATGQPSTTVSPDKLIVRSLATGHEDTIVDHPSGNVRLGILSSPSWSADSERIAFIEDDFTQSSSSPTYRLSTIKADGTGRVPLMTDTQRISFVSWANAPGAPSYYVRHVEVAQAISPSLGALNGGDPLTAGVMPVPWTLPSVAGSSIPLVAEKKTLVRIYVGDASLPAGGSATRRIAYRVGGATLGAAPVEGEGDVQVTAPGAPAPQTLIAGALNVWLPASAGTPGSPVSFDVEVNPDEKITECANCYPNGNRAQVQGASFEEGGRVILQPVEIHLVRAPPAPVKKPAGYTNDIFTGMEPMLPIPDGGVHVRDPVPPLMMAVNDLKPVVGWLKPEFACLAMVSALEQYRAMSPVIPGTGAKRWVGVSTPQGLAGVNVDCGGRASHIPGESFIMTNATRHVAAHELGHTLGLSHTLGFEEKGKTPDGAIALPYIGIGGAGYDSSLVNAVYGPLEYGDLMSYSFRTWISPNSWRRLFDEIRAQSTPGATPTRRFASAAVSRALRKRRLVAGVIHRRRAIFLRTLVAEARAPAATGRVVGRVVALDRRGRRVASAAIRQGRVDDLTELPPFLVALPASARIASLAILPPKGRKPLTTMRRSKHAPTARFLKLRRRASARKALRIAWAARDRDGGKLTVVLQGRRGGGRWKAITIGPSRAKLSVKPSTLGRRGRLGLRLVVSDGLNTRTVRARPISLRP